MPQQRAGRRTAARGALRRGIPALVLILLLPVAGALAQPAPPGDDGSERSRPRLAVGGEITVTIGPRDPDYFNFTDYYQNALRLTVATASLSYALTPWLDLVGEVRTENTDRARLSAAYARVRPHASGRVTLLAGRVPPVFGLFARTRYGSDNPLVSRPLTYQYLTTMRYDALPPSADALLAVRGSGWLVRYRAPGPSAPPGSDPYAPSPATTPGPLLVPPAAGVPLVSTSRWDTGVLATFATTTLEVTGGATVGTLSDPRVDDNNGAWQAVGRAQWQPHASFALGASGARGAFLADTAAAAVGAPGRRFPQAAAAIDLTLAAGHFQARGELAHSSWRLPLPGAPPDGRRLSARGVTLEARYRLHPRVDVAARVDRLDFSPLAGEAAGRGPLPWDAEVTRIEAGAGIRLARRWRLKLAYQHDWRSETTTVAAGFPTAQLSVWF